MKTGVFKRKKLNNRGTTLVEMLATFALVGIFMVSAAQMISFTMNIYFQAKSVSYGHQVSNILMRKITSMVEGARQEAGTEGFAMKISEDNTIIEFYDQTSSHVAITKNDEDVMVIHYYAVRFGESASGGYDAVDWTFDKNTYMGFYVDRLTFEQMGGSGNTDYAPNIIKVTLGIRSPAYGDFTITEYVECYNFTDYSKIDGSSNSITPITTFTSP